MKKAKSLKEWLAERRMSQSVLARLALLHYSTTNLIVSGRLQPSEGQRQKIADALRLAVGDIWPESSKSQEK